MLFGGDGYPRAGVERYLNWAGGSHARVLIATWASIEGTESFKYVVEEFGLRKHQVVRAAKPETASGLRKFTKQLKWATAIFFTGGDQNRVMNLLEKGPNTSALISLIQERVQEGLIYGGTSAGTALVSEKMFTGDADLSKLDGNALLRPGLGLLRGVLVDQHFFERQRQNRLHGKLLLDSDELVGIGIDAGACAAIDSSVVEAMGEGWVQVVDASQKPRRLVLEYLKNGEQYDLGTP